MKKTQKSQMFKKTQNKHFKTSSSTKKKDEKKEMYTWNSQSCCKKNICICPRRSQLHERKNQSCEEQRTIQKKSCVLQEGLSKEKRSRLEVLGRGQIMMQKRKTL